LGSVSAGFGLFSAGFLLLPRALRARRAPPGPKPACPPPWPSRRWRFLFSALFWPVFEWFFGRFCLFPGFARKVPQEALWVFPGPMGPSRFWPVFRRFFACFPGTFPLAPPGYLGLWSLFRAFGPKQAQKGPKRGPFSGVFAGFSGVFACFSGLRPEKPKTRLPANPGLRPLRGPKGPLFGVGFGRFLSVLGASGAPPGFGSPRALLCSVFPGFPGFGLFSPVPGPPGRPPLFLALPGPWPAPVSRVLGPFGPLFGPFGP